MPLLLLLYNASPFTYNDSDNLETKHKLILQEREDLILKIFGCSALLLIGLFFKLKQVCPVENLFNC